MNEYVIRKCQLYDLPLAEDMKILHPELVVLRYEKSFSLDFGAICYLKRRAESRKREQGQYVDLASLSENRCETVRTLIRYISCGFSCCSQRPKSQHSAHAALIRFIDYCDLNKHEDVLMSDGATEVAFYAYEKYLGEKVRLGSLKVSTTSSYLIHIKTFCKEYFCNEHFGKKYFPPGGAKTNYDSVKVPGQDDQQKIIATCMAFFDGFSDLVVNKKPYPYAMKVPEFLGCDNDRLWIFPGKSWCRTASSKMDKPYYAYDYVNGKIRNEVEALKIYGVRGDLITIIRRSIEKANYCMDMANNDYFCTTRIERGLFAIKAFMMIFAAATGCNPTQIIDMEWSEELEEVVKTPTIERQGFRGIKYRARNRIVHFELGVEYMPHLKKYLWLRKYLLNGKRSELLFFGFGVNASERDASPVKLGPGCLTDNFYATLLNKFPSLPKVVPRQWRAAKQDFLIRNNDPVTASVVMQHSLETALKAYSNGSALNHTEEMSNYFSHMDKVIEKNKDVNFGHNNAIGGCESFGRPTPISSGIDVCSPNCQDSMGCLYCDEFRVHLDEIDIRKLFSVRYYFRRIKPFFSEEGKPENTHNKIINRINIIIQAMRRLNNDLVQEVELDVDANGELDYYWMAKLEMLLELQMIEVTG